MSEASSHDPSTSSSPTSNGGTAGQPSASGGAAVLSPTTSAPTLTNTSVAVSSSAAPSSAATVVSLPAVSVVTTPIQAVQASTVHFTSSQGQSQSIPPTISTSMLRGQPMVTPMQVINPNQQYLSQYTLQQQLMLQNAAAVQAAMQAQGISAQQLNLAMQQAQPTAQTQAAAQNAAQNRPNPGGSQKTPMNPPQGGVVLKASSSSSPITVTTNPLVTSGINVKPTGTIVSQATPTIGGKPIMQRQNSQPLVIGQLGVLSAGQSGVPMSTSHQLVGSKSPSLTSQAQLLSSSGGQLRLTSQQTLVTNTGQIIGQPTMIANPAMLNHLQFSPQIMNQEQLRMALQQNQLGSNILTSQQAATLLNSQPLYIRTATPLHHQQLQNVIPAATTKPPTVQLTKPPNPTMQLKANLMSGQKCLTKPTQVIAANRLLNTTQPTNLTLGTIGTNRTSVQTKQVSRVKAQKAKPVSPIPAQPNSRTVQPKLPGSNPDLSSVMVQPKLQQQHAQHQKVKTSQHQATTTAASQQQHLVKYTQIQSKPNTTPTPPTSNVTLDDRKDNVHKQSTQAKPERTKTPPTTNQPISIPSHPQQPVQVGQKTQENKATKQTDKPSSLNLSQNGVGEQAMNGDPCMDSGESPMETDPPEENGKEEKRPLGPGIMVEKQKAVVKPQVLTHIIEGFVIEEGPEPFPVQRSSLLTEFIPPRNQCVQNDSDNSSETSRPGSADPHTKLDQRLPDKNNKPGPIIVETDGDKPKLKCEFCGKIDYAWRFRGSKRFCSNPCAKRYNVGCSRRLGLFKGRTEGQNGQGGDKKANKKRKTSASSQSKCPSEASTASTASEATSGEDERGSTHSNHESTPPRSPPVLEREGDLDPAASEPPRKKFTPQWSISTVEEDVRATPEPKKPITQWSVSEVYEFIRSLTGSAVHAAEFRSQEIDGQALLLLKEDHLMSAMNMKLGPALKICARINHLKDDMN